MNEALRGPDSTADCYQDAHELADANHIRHRFVDRKVTNRQIVLFGLTGSLIPCPAPITALPLCLQLKQFSLGFVLVLCFSIALALTLVTVGAAAVLSAQHATKHFGRPAHAPSSSLLIVVVGLGVQGRRGWRPAAITIRFRPQKLRSPPPFKINSTTDADDVWPGLRC